MRLFYLILFDGFGLFILLAAILDFKWYTDYQTRRSGRKNRSVTRLLTGAAGAALILYGILYYIEIL